jgi:hypothetical protein
MKSSIAVIKKSRGRPKSTGIGTLVGVRFHESELKAIDGWRKKQTEKLTRPQAVRRLVGRALEGK